MSQTHSPPSQIQYQTHSPPSQIPTCHYDMYYDRHYDMYYDRHYDSHYDKYIVRSI